MSLNRREIHVITVNLEEDLALHKTYKIDSLLAPFTRHCYYVPAIVHGTNSLMPRQNHSNHLLFFLCMQSHSLRTNTSIYPESSNYRSVSCRFVSMNESSREKNLLIGVAPWVCQYRHLHHHSTLLFNWNPQKDIYNSYIILQPGQALTVPGDKCTRNSKIRFLYFFDVICLRL